MMSHEERVYELITQAVRSRNDDDRFSNLKFPNVIEEAESLNKDYRRLLTDSVWEIDDLDVLISYFDVCILIYLSLYNRTSEALRRGSLFSWKGYEKNFSLVFPFLLRAILHDITTLRNLAVLRLDTQFHATSRNLMEKMKILYLCLVDEDFFSAYSGKVNIDKKTLYKEFTKPSKIDSAISIIAKNGPQHELASLLCSKSVEMRTKLGHSFVHTNNFSSIFAYYNEGGKVNLSPLHSSINANAKNYQMIAELNLLYYGDLTCLLNNRGAGKRSSLEKIHPQIYELYIKRYYG